MEQEARCGRNDDFSAGPSIPKVLGTKHIGQISGYMNVAQGGSRD